MFPLPQLLQDPPYIHSTKSLSQQKETNNKKRHKNVKKTKSSQKYIEFILWLPTKPWHVACAGAWLISPMMLHWAKLTFPLTEGITTANNFKERELGIDSTRRGSCGQPLPLCLLHSSSHLLGSVLILMTFKSSQGLDSHTSYYKSFHLNE